MEGENLYEGLLEHERELKRYLGRLARPCYPAEDLLQETYLEAFKTLQHHGPPENAGGWLKRIAQRTAWRLVRREERYIPRSTEDGRLNEQEVGGEEPTMGLVREEDAYHLRTALTSLTDREQRILRGYYWEGLLCREIAEELDTTAETVRVGLYKARVKLRGLLR